MRFKKTVRQEARLAAKKLISEYSIFDAGGLQALQIFADAYTLELDSIAQVETDGLTFLDRFGQVKAHPLLATIRDARAQKMAALKSLNLDIEPLRERPGRP